jgi:hypothetical protein
MIHDGCGLPFPVLSNGPPLPLCDLPLLISPAGRPRAGGSITLCRSKRFPVPPAMMVMVMGALLLHRWLQQGRRHSLILEANALLLRRPPLHKLGLSLQLRLLSLYIPKRLSVLRLDRGIAWLALQLLDFGERDRHARGWLMDWFYRRQSPHVPAAGGTGVSTHGSGCVG